MCNEHGGTIEGRQEHTQANHEKSSRDQNIEDEKRETSEVGQPKNDRTGTAGTRESRGAVPRSLDEWLEFETREISENPESAGSDRV